MTVVEREQYHAQPARELEVLDHQAPALDQMGRAGGNQFIVDRPAMVDHGQAGADAVELVAVEGVGAFDEVAGRDLGFDRLLVDQLPGLRRRQIAGAGVSARGGTLFDECCESPIDHLEITSMQHAPLLQQAVHGGEDAVLLLVVLGAGRQIEQPRLDVVEELGEARPQKGLCGAAQPLQRFEPGFLLAFQ